MRTRLARLTALAIITLVPSVYADTNDEQAIRNLQSNFAEAFNAKDVNAIMKAYAPDQSLVVFDVVPPRQYVGADAYRKDWESFFASIKGPVKFTISDLMIKLDGNMGYSRSIQNISGTDVKGQPILLNLRVTDVYQKLNDKWLIVHEHVSVPVNLDTKQADLTSKP